MYPHKQIDRETLKVKKFHGFFIQPIRGGQIKKNDEKNIHATCGSNQQLKSVHAFLRVSNKDKQET